MDPSPIVSNKHAPALPKRELSQPVHRNGVVEADGSIALSDYLLTRISQLGIKHLLGVPGDFNLLFLDYVMRFPGLEWIGSSNELNGGYSADGYARTHGISAFLTTFGVGELSAMNAMAGAYAEQSPVIHIVGYPSSQTQPGVILHHSLGKGTYTEFFDMSASISVDRIIINKDTRESDIDQVIEAACVRRCPVYIGLPLDLVGKKMSPPQKALSPFQKLNDPALEQRAILEIQRVIRDSKSPVILLDAGASRDEVRHEVEALVRALNWPCFVTTMGKGSVDEQIDTFAGCYVGALSFPDVQAAFESADCILSVGLFRSDLNTGFFSENYEWTKSVELHDRYTLVHGARFDQIGMKHLIPALIPFIQNIPSSITTPKEAWYMSTPPIRKTGLVSQDYLWRRLSTWFKPNDIIYAETGSSAFGLLDIRFPPGVALHSNYHWASIGFATAAMCGACYAAPDRRVLGFLGDGSFQLTFQEISNLVRRKCSATIFVVDNNGYGIERHIRGTVQPYNDIHGWRYDKTFEYFGGEGDVRTAETDSQLDRVLSDPSFGDGKGLKMCVIKCDALDGPRMMSAMAHLKGRTNASGKLDPTAP